MVQTAARRARLEAKAKREKEEKEQKEAKERDEANKVSTATKKSKRKAPEADAPEVKKSKKHKSEKEHVKKAKKTKKDKKKKKKKKQEKEEEEKEKEEEEEADATAMDEEKEEKEKEKEEEEEEWSGPSLEEVQRDIPGLLETMKATKQAWKADRDDQLLKSAMKAAAKAWKVAKAIEKQHLRRIAGVVDAVKEESEIVFVGNLDFGVEEKDVKAFFQDCGEITDVHWVEDSAKEFKGCGFLTFASKDAARAATQLDGATLFDRAMRVNFAKSSQKKKREQWKERRQHRFNSEVRS